MMKKHFWRREARKGDASAQMWLAAAYEEGWFGKAKFPEALKWYRRSAEQGDADAQNALGQMYENGESVAQNYSLAARWSASSDQIGLVGFSFSFLFLFAFSNFSRRPCRTRASIRREITS